MSLQEIRERAEAPPYSIDPLPAAAVRPRAHWPLVAAALVLVAGVVAALAWYGTRRPPAVNRSPAPRYLPTTVPDGVHLTAKAEATPAPQRVLARLAPSAPAQGWIELAAVSGPVPPADADFAEPVDIGAQRGTVSHVPGGLPVLTWSDGRTTYTVSGVGGNVAEYEALARSVGSGGDVRALALPAGWSALPLVPLPDAAVTLDYADRGTGAATLTVAVTGGGLVDQVATAWPGAERLRHGDRTIVVADWGRARIALARFGRSGYVEAVAHDLDDATVTALVGSVAEVSSAEWAAVVVDPASTAAYRPEPATYAPVVTVEGVQLEGQPGPNGSWCLRTVPAAASPGPECATTHDESGVHVVDLTDGPSPSRAAFGVSTLGLERATVFLDDGTMVAAHVAPAGSAGVVAWLADVPAGRRIRAVEGRDNMHVVWHVGR